MLPDFVLRQFLLLLAPVGLLWVGLIILTIALWWKRQRGFAFFAGTLVTLITVVGSTPLPDAMLAHLERPYAGLRPETLPVADAIVLLGGGFQPSRHEVGRLHLTKAGDRAVMTLELMRLDKAPVIVIGGAATRIDGNWQVEADLAREWLGRWQPAAAGEIISLGACANTYEEALKVRALMEARSWNTVLLVTSASHMHRAAATFRKAGAHPIPAPCNFMSEIGTGQNRARSLIPTYVGFEQAAVWLHETCGWTVYARRGWL